MTYQNNAILIMDQSWELFQRKGYRGVSIDEICKQCNLTKPTLYYYFKNKEMLFIKVLEYKMQGLNESLSQRGTLEEKLERFALNILEGFDSGFSLLMREHEHFKNLEYSYKIGEAFHTNLFFPLQELIKSGIESKKIKDKNLHFLSLTFLGIINILIGKAEDLDQEKAVLAKEIVEIFLSGAQYE